MKLYTSRARACLVHRISRGSAADAVAVTTLLFLRFSLSEARHRRYSLRARGELDAKLDIKICRRGNYANDDDDDGDSREKEALA